MEDRNLRYAEKLAALIRIRTISSGGADPAEFARFREALRTMFPRIFEAAETEDFDGSLLLRIRGKDPERQPVLLMSHHDVVEAPGRWKYPPFDGVIADGRLWGRGTLDTKGNLFAMLSAAEELLAEGFVPARDLYFESACDEETNGGDAEKISRALQKRGLRFYMTLDEGGMMMYDPIGGADGVFAMVGVGEKDCVDLKFTARSTGGHASTPGKNTPLVRLGAFMARADTSRLFDTRLSPVVSEMFKRFAPYCKGVMKTAFKNADRLKGLLCATLPGISDTAGAMLKTTLAFTMCGGSDGRNVLPQEAWVIGNMRCSHHQGRDASVEQVRKLAERYGVETEVLDPGFGSGLTDYRGEPFRFIEKALGTVFPDVVPVPYLMTGASDSRFFGRVSDHCLRFAPFRIDDKQLESIHGIDENVSVEALGPAVDFFRYILKEM